MGRLAGRLFIDGCKVLGDLPWWAWAFVALSPIVAWFVYELITAPLQSDDRGSQY